MKAETKKQEPGTIRRRSSYNRSLRKDNRQLFSMCVPGIILLALFAYLPMFGLVLAFKNYKFNLGIFGSEWVGFKNFEFFFTSGTFGRLIRNTLGLNLLFLLCNTVITVLLALLLYEINSRHAIKAFQTVIFLPFIVSWVAASYWHDNFYSVNRSWDSGVNIRQEDNTYVEGGDFSQYPAAQAIIDNAGLTDPSVKDGVRMGIAEKHNVTLMQYPDGEAYYFEKPAGLLTFTIPSQIGNTQYDKLAHTANILMPESTDRTSLAGNFTMAPGFTCDKASGSRQNFTSPVVYTFTDGTDTIAWTVTVTCDVTADGPLVGTETTLDAAIAARSDWTQEPAGAENGGTLFTTVKGFSAYIGDRISNDAILEFDVQSVLDGNDWTGYALRMQNPYDMLGTMYHIVFKQDAIELQKWVNGNRTMLIGTIEGYDPVYGDVENKFYTSDVRHSIKTGAIDVPTGVRLFLYIDGNKVFDVIDADDPITNDGFFGMYPMTHDMTLLPFSNIDTSPKPDPGPDPEPNPILPILPSGGQSAWKNPYQDVTDSSSYYEAVRYVTEKGLMNGTSASTFSPDAAMTRAMMVTILWRMEKEPAALRSNFMDLTADWYRTAVDWAAETGVVNGVGNGKFAPNATLSLEQLITILYRYAENKGYNVSKSASLDSFTDGSAVSAYAKPAMQWAVGMNFLSGNTLTPGAPASRAQIAQVLMLFCKAYIK